MNFSLQTHEPQSPPAPGALTGPTHDLPQRQRPGRRRGGSGLRPLWIGAALALVGGGVALAVLPSTRKAIVKLFAADQTDLLTYQVHPGKLVVTVKERGNLESSNNKEVRNEVEGQTMIVMIKPEGTHVRKGDLVCELDSAALKDSLINQEITTKGAKALFDNAEKTYNVAVIAVKEYVEGIYPQELQADEGEIVLAQSNLTKANDRLEWSNRMVPKNYVSIAQNLADKSAKLNAEITLASARKKRDVLKNFTAGKTIEERKAEVFKTQSDMLAKKATLELEKEKEDKLRTQIEKCKLYAPTDGLVVYANETNRMGASNQAMIEEGAMVRERQSIFSLPDIDHMRVNTKIHESKIERIAAGQRAQIRIDSFAKDLLSGTVEEIKTMPDPTGWMNSGINVYSTLVSIDRGLPGLRPGMSAEVEIMIAQKDDVLSVPVQAIVALKGKNTIFVMTPDGPKRRQVKLGLTNDKYTEISEGLKDGDVIAMNPTALLTEDEHNAIADGTKDSGKKGWSSDAAGKTEGGSPGLGGAGGEAKKKSARGKRGARGKMDPSKLSPDMKAQFEKFQNADPEEKQRMMEQFKAANPGGFGGGGGGGPQGGPGS